MVLAVIKIDKNFWEINKEKKEVKIVKIDENKILEKIYTDVPCLVADTKGYWMKAMVFEATEDDGTIESTGASLLDTKNYFTFIEKYENKKIAIYLKKAETVKMFKEFTFSKIIPLDVILFRMAVKHKSEIVGIAGDKTLSYSRKINFKKMESFFLNEGEYSSLLFEPNSNVDVFIGVMMKILHIKKTFFTDKEIAEEELDKINAVSLSYNDFMNLITKEKTFVIKDKYSDNYQSKNYRKILLGVSALSIALSPYFFYKYIEIKGQNAYYKSIYTNLQNKMANIRNTEKRYKTDYLYKIYKPFDYQRFYKEAEKFSSVSGITEYKYKAFYFPVKKNTVIQLKIEKIDNFRKFEKDFKTNIVSYKVSPKTHTITATIQLEKNKKRGKRRRRR